MKLSKPFLFIFCFFFFLCGCSTPESPRGFEQYSLDTFLNTITYENASFSFDEKRILFSSNQTGTFNAYSMSIREAVTDQKATPLTNSTNHSIHALTFFPNDDRILYSKDENGNEQFHIYMREGNGAIRDLTPSPSARSIYYEWTHDFTCFVYGTNARDPRFMDFYEMDIESFQPHLIFQNDEGFIYGCLSPNRRYLALSKTTSKNRLDMFLYDIETKTLKQLTQQQADAEFRPQVFSLDSSALYYLTNEDSDFTYVKKLDLTTGKERIEYKEPWDIINFSISHKSTYDTITINEDAKHKVRVFHHTNKTPLKLPKHLQDSITRTVISRSEEQMVLYLNNDVSPTNFYLYRIIEKKHKQLTHALPENLNSDVLVQAKSIRYKAKDGQTIPALYYQPKMAKQTNQVPGLIWVHEGPGSQSKASYNSMIQFLANQGYAILAVNYRGSEGYGKTFYQSADGKQGVIDLQDCIDGKKYLIGTGVVDPDKIGIIGSSYGGYIALAALAFHPEEMVLGIDLFGVSNWLATLRNIPDRREKHRLLIHEKIGYPEKDKECLVEISPLFHVHKIKKPLLVLQGSNDPCVLTAQTEGLIAAAEQEEIPYRYILFDDEGHNLMKRRNKLLAGKAILEFVKKYF